MIQNIFLKNLRKGQATVEYVLLLVVLVFIVIGLKEVLFKPFNDEFMPLYKEYYVCFMETAALPGIKSCTPRPTWDQSAHTWPAGGSTSGGWTPGNTSGGWNPGSTSGGWNPGSTSGGWNPGSTTGGWNPGNTTGGWNPGSTTGGWNPGNTTGGWGEYSNNDASTGASKTPKDSFPVSGKGKNNKFFNSSNNNNQFLAQSSSEDLNDDLNRDRKKKKNRRKFKVKRKKDNNSTLTSARGDRFNQRSSQGDRFLMSGRAYDFEEAEEEKRQTAIAVSTDKSNKKSGSEKKATFVVDNKRKQQTQIEDTEPITFGRFMKYIFIGLLILGILFFIGSQLMQVNENLKAS